LDENKIDYCFFKEILEENIILYIMTKKEQNLITLLDVKAVFGKLNKDIELIGEASFGRSFNKKFRLELLHIEVRKSYRRRGIGSKMYTLGIDFVKKDGITKEIVGDITSADNLEIAIGFYKKNNCKIITKRIPDGDLIFCKLNLKNLNNLKFYPPPKIEPITEKEFNTNGRNQNFL
jgi:ribosomal protein S18 acetylase RimI-like enzyme